MKILEVVSEKHGTFKIKLDDKDYLKATTIGKTSKWCVRVCKNRHNLFYFQKRLSDGKLIELHRMIMGFPIGMTVDHKNGDTLDNRKRNLHICLNRANIRKGKTRVNNKTGYSGILFKKNHCKHPYAARIRVNYKTISLGSYLTFEEAVKARKEAEVKYYDC